ncbi:hypothetical protein SAMN05421805_117100 [Saccharopolyspora antimicrobica]|uniref:Uncharacterized protein n=2 Tax=Saccharopolyspora TaxID=1835 RepID=A0A1I5I4F4_9PSEU|nr:MULTISPECIES: hypothetical protein [Saccharopolyspora]RKT83040.1 hypothetical protein ATL45_1312 [Saccharopolyspora antimicrobica]SEG75290.1 hypothetical protein SAMN02982929_03430 [Saccharopolyspora kobensis]SFC95934.1 hypothetical protein SAMN05216506_10223 [Saccharopolyspora kobensis]SFO55474.1 hypothetical protein SAMN05421805_117100 [Saccharopolyspora antimicrobica]
MASGHITANYLPEGDDWLVTVTTDADQRSARAPGLIAARDQADQLIEQLAPSSVGRIVIHLLDGDGFAFTTAYLQARHGVTAQPGR